nr:ATP-binding protein [Myxococcus sp. MH1]
MSRAKIRAALVRARQGEKEFALADLRMIENQEAVRRHLRFAINRNDPAALSLWKGLFPNEDVLESPTSDTADVARSSLAVRSPERSTLTLPSRIELSNPAPLLTMLGSTSESTIHFNGTFITQVWALVGIAALGREPSSNAWQVNMEGYSNGVGFARALGLQDAILGYSNDDWGEPGRTVKLRRIREMKLIEPVASRISTLIAPTDHVAQATLYYVVVELLRNVLQHSRDPLGAVVAAQAMTEAQQYSRPAVQVAVADTGIGILEHLRGKHRELRDASSALEKALRAHISGTFEEGLTGSLYNAGFGLFAIAELAKLTGGRLLLASRGAALSIQGDRNDVNRHSSSIIGPIGTGFPGTLVAFELPLGDTRDFSVYMEAVKQRAKQQTPARAVHRWIAYENPPSGAQRILVNIVRENTDLAAEIGKKVRNSILAGEPIVLDFAGLSFVTQSFLHALLFRPLRLAWADAIPIHAMNVSPAVRSALEALEEYALGG